MLQKTVTIVIPTFNEEDNIREIYQCISGIFENKLPSYKVEFLFIDNCSTDNSQGVISDLAKSDQNVKAIFNARNFGFNRSTFYGLTQSTGDCAILIFADMQDPPEVIPEFIKKWEEGYKVVAGVRKSSDENPIMFFIRKCYYYTLEKISEIDHIKQFNGFGLYDRIFLDVLRELDDPLPYLRGVVAELGFKQTTVKYAHKKRHNGKSKFNFYKLYDVAMLGITSYSKVVMRMATIFGFFMSICSLIIAGVTFIHKLLHWDSFPVGSAAISIGVFVLGAVQLFFIGLLGEYILNINTRSLRRPLVIEERRINFDN